MKANLFKNFKTLKEKEEEIKNSDHSVLDNVSELKEDVKTSEASTKKLDKEMNENKEVLEDNKSELVLNEKTSSNKVVKKRPVKKEILEARAALAKPESTVEYSKKIVADESKRTFTIFLKSSTLEFLKDLVFYKATAERQIFYNQSEAITESLGLMMDEFKNISPRPDFIRDQEKSRKGGRKRNSDEVYDASTTVYISGQSFDFVKDVTYNKVISGDLYFKDWDFLESAVMKLKEKYGNNIQPRPDYIREDEKLRGRRKAES